jgi:hypothetical protein
MNHEDEAHVQALINTSLTFLEQRLIEPRPQEKDLNRRLVEIEEWRKHVDGCQESGLDLALEHEGKIAALENRPASSQEPTPTPSVEPGMPPWMPHTNELDHIAARAESGGMAVVHSVDVEDRRAIVDALKAVIVARWQAHERSLPASSTGTPIPMVLHCPRCRAQHIDAPQPDKGWTNPPHRSHECQACGLVWRPADVPTTGVEAIETKGKRDTTYSSAVEPTAAPSTGTPSEFFDTTRASMERQRAAQPPPIDVSKLPLMGAATTEPVCAACGERIGKHDVWRRSVESGEWFHKLCHEGPVTRAPSPAPLDVDSLAKAREVCEWIALKAEGLAKHWEDASGQFASGHHQAALQVAEFARARLAALKLSPAPEREAAEASTKESADDLADLASVEASTLPPCPYCSSKGDAHGMLLDGWFWVECSWCGVRGPRKRLYRHAAVEAWKLMPRGVPAPAADVREAERLLKELVEAGSFVSAAGYPAWWPRWIEAWKSARAHVESSALSSATKDGAE